MKKLNRILAALAILLIAVWLALDFSPLGRFLNGCADEVASTLGYAVGTAVGSYTGFTEGRAEGKKAGKSAGLSAEDTQTELEAIMASRKYGRLTVMTADITLENFQTYGEGDMFGNPAYAVLYRIDGKATFTVDLSSMTAEYGDDENEIVITIPDPSAAVSIDEDTLEILDEYERAVTNGSTKDGITAAINSRAKMAEKTPEELENYDALMTQAREAARDQLTGIARAATIGGKTIEVQILQEEE